jgi:hypothetical protein
LARAFGVGRRRRSRRHGHTGNGSHVAGHDSDDGGAKTLRRGVTGRIVHRQNRQHGGSRRHRRSTKPIETLQQRFAATAPIASNTAAIAAIFHA